MCADISKKGDLDSTCANRTNVLVLDHRLRMGDSVFVQFFYVPSVDQCVDLYSIFYSQALNPIYSENLVISQYSQLCHQIPKFGPLGIKSESLTSISTSISPEIRALLLWGRWRLPPTAFIDLKTINFNPLIRDGRFSLAKTWESIKTKKITYDVKPSSRSKFTLTRSFIQEAQLFVKRDQVIMCYKR